jgi:hypothetical protein
MEGAENTVETRISPAIEHYNATQSLDEPGEVAIRIEGERSDPIQSNPGANEKSRCPIFRRAFDYCRRTEAEAELIGSLQRPGEYSLAAQKEAWPSK